MIHNDAEKLARQCWDKTSKTLYDSCQIEHQLRLCTVVSSIADQVALGSSAPEADVTGLEDFEAAVIKQLSKPSSAPKQLEAAKSKEEK